MFTKDDHHFILMIKYVTTAEKYNILDIETIKLDEEHEGLIVVIFVILYNIKFIVLLFFLID